MAYFIVYKKNEKINNWLYISAIKKSSPTLMIENGSITPNWSHKQLDTIIALWFFID